MAVWRVRGRAAIAETASELEALRFLCRHQRRITSWLKRRAALCLILACV